MRHGARAAEKFATECTRAGTAARCPRSARAGLAIASIGHMPRSAHNRHEHTPRRTRHGEHATASAATASAATAFVQRSLSAHATHAAVTQHSTNTSSHSLTLRRTHSTAASCARAYLHPSRTHKKMTRPNRPRKHSAAPSGPRTGHQRSGRGGAQRAWRGAWRGSKKRRTAASRIPAWSPTAVLTRRYHA